MIVNDIYDNLKGIPLNRKIAIWGMRKDSLEILNQTINARISVEYFVDDIGDYEGPNLFHKKILRRNELIKNDIYVLVCDTEYRNNKEWINQYLDGRFYIVELGKISKEIRESDCVYIYGAGQDGKHTLQILEKENIEIRGFIDSDEKKIGSEWCNYPIYSKNVINEDDTIIVSTMYYAEICRMLANLIDINQIFVDYRNSRATGKTISFEDMNSIWIQYKDYPFECMELCYSLYATLWNDFETKKIILYGNNEIADQVIEIATLLGLTIEYIVDDDVVDEVTREDNYIVKNTYDLAYEDFSDKIVIITKVDIFKSEKEKKIVLDSGEKLDLLSIKRYCQYRSLFSMLYAHKKPMVDKLLDYVETYEKTNKDYIGFYIQESKKQHRRIVILGGSTSDYGLYENMIKSWPELLYEKYDFTVINGGIQGYDSVRECLKLLRDVGQMKPDLVISYSGVNECGRPLESPNPFIRSKIYENEKDMVWYGVKNEIDICDNWIMMEKYMQAISNVNGSDFIAIVQPALFTKKQLSYEEKRLSLIWNKNNMFVQRYANFLKKVKISVCDLDWMYDLSDAFETVNETVYRDGCHLNEHGNEIIADKIYEVIIDFYMRKGNKL